MSDAVAVPEEYVGLIDDAAIFPPGDLPLPEAVAAHRRFAATEHAALVGPFVVDDRRLGDLVREEDQPPRVAVVVTGGAGAIEPCVGRVAACGLSLAQLETALRDLDDLPAAARRVVAASEAAGVVVEDVPVYVEVPWAAGVSSHGWLAALDVLAEADLRLKLRTGGAADVPVPPVSDLAAAMDAALDRGLRFKCSGGLHHAVGDGGTGRHGFLNVLLAVATLWDGRPVTEAVGLLERDDEAQVAAAAREARSGLVSARRWLASVGSCGVAEPLSDLRRLGLVP
jgi:hypothetical protein